MSESLRRIWAIALSTFRESMRSKILYSVMVFAALIIGASALFGSVTIGDQVKVIKDFGLFALSLFSVLYCVISGSTLLHKELARKTIFNLLSKPVKRWEFLTGKFFGMLGTVTTLVLLMAAGFSAFIYLFEETFRLNLLQGYFHLILELTIVCAAVLFFSSIVVTPLLIGLFAFGFFLAGRSLDVLLYFIQEELVGGTGALLIKALYWILPQLNMINVSDALVYDIPVSLEQTLYSTVYAIAYSAVLLLLAQMIFQKREFH